MTHQEAEFVGMVRDYVALIDRCEHSPAHELLSTCARLLPRIYAAGLELPDVEPDTPNSETPELPSPMTRLMQLFGRYDSYFEVFDPVFDRDCVASSLADDLTDMYLDFARSLARYDAGLTSDAIWEWRFNLQGHCGDHLTDALRVIHRLVNDHMPADYKAQVEGAG